MNEEDRQSFKKLNEASKLKGAKYLKEVAYKRPAIFSRSSGRNRIDKRTNAYKNTLPVNVNITTKEEADANRRK